MGGVHHVALICSDYREAKAFYVELLGFEVLDENYREDRRSWKLDLSIPGGGQLELFTFSHAPTRPSDPEAQGLRHLCFGVSKLDAWVTYLRDQGVAVEEIRIDPYTGKRFTFFKDPDNLPLELYESV